MSKRNTHIISKFRWDTVFDSRERAFELQERLSDWSRNHLQREATNVFNRLCPAEQSWKIGRLELDLGVIDFNNLEAALTEKISRCLAETLTDQVMYAKNDGGNITVTSEDISVIDMLNRFLLYGVLPWNTSTEATSVNELLSGQLRTNFRNIITWLWEVGATGQVVRKRMAWQISEPNLTKILEGLEPNNHDQIMEITNELATIQQKEMIVQAGSKDFRKHLWFWILNFLYSERGSVFNRTSFMKSSIRQMADHYNIGYAQLFAIIEEAVEKIGLDSNSHSGFIFILQELVKEHKAGSTDDLTKTDTTDYWHIVEELLKGNSVTGYQSDDVFNELVINLSRHNGHRFKKLIASLNLTQNAWTAIALRLKETSLEAIVMAMDAERAGFIVEAIHFLIKLCREQNIETNRALLWATGIRNLRQNKNAATGNRLFMMDCILCLGKANQVSWEKMLVQLIGARIPSVCKTEMALEVFTALTDVFLIEISNRPPSFFNNRFIELTGSFYELLEQADTNQEKLISLQQSLRKYMQLYPSGALELLVQHADQEKIQKLFLHLVDNHTAGLLLQHAAAASYYPVLMAIQKQLKQFGNHHTAGKMIRFIENHLLRTGLRLAVVFPGAGRNEFIGKLFRELLSVLPLSLQQDFREFIAMLVAGGNKEGLANVSPAIEKIWLELIENKEEKFMEQVHALMGQGKQGLEQASGMLRANFGEQHFVSIRKTGDAEATTLMNYLVDGAGKIMQGLIDASVQLLTTNPMAARPEELTANLRELFWKCLLDNSAHRGELERFRKVFKTAVYACFGVENTQDYAPVLQTGTAMQGQEAVSPSYADMLRMLRLCFENCSETITYQNRDISFRELVSIVMDIDGAAVYRIISSLSLSEKQVSFIGPVVSFTELCDWIIDQGTESTNMALEELNLLFQLTTALSTEGIDGVAEKEFLNQAVLLCTRGELSEKSLTALLPAGDVSPNQIASAITESGSQPGPVLRSVLIDRYPALEELLPAQAARNGKEWLQALNRKGLLYQLIKTLLLHGKTPLWFASSEEKEAGILLSEIIRYYPAVFSRVYRMEPMTEERIRWMEMSIQVEDVFRLIGRRHGNRRLLMLTLSDLYKSFSNITINGISGHQLQAILFKKIMTAWTTGNWDLISATQIWNELAWDTCLGTGLTKNDFLQGIEQHKSLLPVSLQLSMEEYKAAAWQAPELSKPLPAPKPFKRPRPDHAQEPVVGEGIAIRNAGLVILNSYIPLLFDRMGLLKDGKFLDSSAQNDAVHFLQYLVTGAYETEECLLPLNKILCGLDMTEPVTDYVVLTDIQREMMDGLLLGVIAHWPDAGSNTPDGVRGNWLVRNGILRKDENCWELTVERKSYDLLLGRAPFSFSLIKFPWMPNPLTVKWRI